jgi:hypothetical protein
MFLAVSPVDHKVVYGGVPPIKSVNTSAESNSLHWPKIEKSASILRVSSIVIVSLGLP